jgi:hypothetical protein
MQVRALQLSYAAHDLRADSTTTERATKSSTLHDDHNALTCTFTQSTEAIATTTTARRARTTARMHRTSRATP